MRARAWCKIRNIRGITTLACIALGMLGACVAVGYGDYARDKRNIYLFIPVIVLYGGSHIIGLFSTPTFFISLILSLFSKYTVHELKQKLESLGYHIDQEDLIEIQNSIAYEDNQL